MTHLDNVALPPGAVDATDFDDVDSRVVFTDPNGRATPRVVVYLCLSGYVDKYSFA
jgi:hypothetical protein